MLRAKNFSSSDHVKTVKGFGYKLAADQNAKDISKPFILDNGSLDAALESSSNYADKSIDNGHLQGNLAFQLWLVDDKSVTKEVSITKDKPISISNTCTRVQVFIDWSEKELEKYDTHYLEILPEVFKSGFPSKKARHDSISLYTCLEAFLREEPLVPEEMW